MRDLSRGLLASSANEQSRRFITEFLAEINRAALAFVDDHLSPTAAPGQKLVLLRRAG